MSQTAEVVLIILGVPAVNGVMWAIIIPVIRAPPHRAARLNAVARLPVPAGLSTPPHLATENTEVTEVAPLPSPPS